MQAGMQRRLQHLRTYLLHYSRMFGWSQDQLESVMRRPLEQQAQLLKQLHAAAKQREQVVAAAGALPQPQHMALPPHPQQQQQHMMEALAHQPQPQPQQHVSVETLPPAPLPAVASMGASGPSSRYANLFADMFD